MTAAGSAAPGPAAPVARQGDAEAARDQAGRVVHCVYRLVKGLLMHDDANQAIAPLVEAVALASAEYCAISGGDCVSILFAANNVFVDRLMLRASRETYQLALELGEMLEPFGLTEIALNQHLDRAEVQELGSAIALAQRDKQLAQKERLTRFSTIRVRRIVAFRGGEQLTPAQKMARTYAASVLIVQSFYRQLREGGTELPHGVKRVSQRLVTAAEEDSRLLLVIAASPTSETDRAAAAVSTAIIALAMARQLVTDRSALLALASAALLYDVGRTRLVRSAHSAVERSLSDAEQEKLPASTVASLTALGKLHQGSQARSVVAYEALSLRLGTSRVYGGRRPPTVLARVLHAARTFVEARATHGPMGGGASMDDAVQALFGQARDATERTYAKLLLGALGLFPAGTLVELTTGELAVVTATPRLPIDFARPPVRVLYDDSANLLETPLDVDLALPAGPGTPVRLIKRTVDADEQQMRQMRAYVVGLSTAGTRTPRKEPAPLPPPMRPQTSGQAGPPQAKATLRPRTSGRSPQGAAVPPRVDAPVVQDAPLDAIPPSEQTPSEQAPREAVPSSGGAIPSSRGARPRATVRPRPDPRADEDSGRVESVPPPASAPQPPTAPAPPPPENKLDTVRARPPAQDAEARKASRPMVAVSAARAASHATQASTRAISWDTYGQMVDGAEASEAKTPTVPPAPGAPEPTDSLLAAYLEEAPSRGGGAAGLRGWGNEPPSQRDSSGQRWGRDSSSGSPSSQGDSSRRDPISAGGPPSRGSSSQRGWGAGARGSRPNGPPSSQPPRSRGGRTKTSTQDWTLGRPNGPPSPRPSSAPKPPSQPPVPPPPPEEPRGPMSRKPKAGGGGWGTDRK